MKISVITVCFNSAATVADTLRSVAIQTWPNVEHIVVDGASRDDTMKVIEPWRSGLAQLVSEPDRGMYDAMNKGLALATGDVVAFLNSDDRYANDGVLAEIGQRMGSDDGTDALFGDVAFFRPGSPEQVVRRYNSGRFRPERLGWGWMPAHPAQFIRRSVYERFGGFRSDYRIAGDFEFTARAFGRGQLRYQHVPQVMVRMSLGGASTAGLRSTILLNREVMRACRDNGIETSWPRLMAKYPLKLLEFLQR